MHKKEYMHILLIDCFELSYKYKFILFINLIIIFETFIQARFVFLIQKFCDVILSSKLYFSFKY